VKLLPRRGAGVGVLAAVVAAALVAGIGAALVPAVQASRAEPRAEPAACADAAPSLVRRLQQYVDAIARPITGAPADGVVDVAVATEAYAAQLNRLGCDRAAQRLRLTRALGALTGSNAVAKAVAATLRARLGDDPLEEPVRRELRAGEDLSAVAAGLPAGSTLVLPPGRLRLPDPLVLLQPLTIVGAGRERTTVASSARDFAVLHLGPGQLVLRALTIAHEGGAAASLVVVPAGGYVLASVRLTGARGSGGAGGNGILVGVRRAGAAGAAAITASDLSHNTGAGLAVAVADSPSVTRTTFAGNGACGVCLRGAARGRYVGNRFTDNGIGIDVGDVAAPVLIDNDITRSRSVGLSLRGRAGGSATGNTLTASRVAGIVAKDAVTTRLERNRLSGHDKVGAAFTGTTRAVFSANEVTGAGVGVQIDGSAAPVISGNVLRGSRRAAGLVAGTSAPSVSGSRCVGSALGWVVSAGARPVFGRDACSRSRQQGRSG
jgi:parallel beta-helix repeat protein